MGLWETVRSWFVTEAESAREVARNLETEWSADLDRKESELRAGPAEQLESLQDRIAGNTSAFDEIKAKIESSGTADVESDMTATPADDDIVDAELIDDSGEAGRGSEGK
jgi:hypothetical protein